jgi:MFS family permease
MDLEPLEPFEASIPATGIWRALRHRNFRLYFIGQLVSLTGTWSQMLAVSWLVWRLTGSAFWLGFVGFTTQLPMLILGLPGGAFADRYDRLRAFRILETLCMIEAALLAWLTMTGRIELWQVIALSAGVGVIYAFEFPVRQALVMDLAGRRDLMNAISLSSAVFHVSRMIGPIAAGLIVERMGEGPCFLLNAATFLFLIALLFMIDRRKMLKAEISTESVMRSIALGLKHTWSAPRLRLALAITALMAGVGLQYTTLMPIFADDVFAGGARTLGWLMGGSGLGSLAGCLWLAKRENSDGLLKLAAISAVVFSVGLVAFSRVNNFMLALGIMSVLGFCLALVFSGMNTLLQHESPNELRGRVMSLYTTTFMGVAPFGSLAAGSLARALGAPLTLTAAGFLCIIGSILILIRARHDDFSKKSGTTRHVLKKT